MTMLIKIFRSTLGRQILNHTTMEYDELKCLHTSVIQYKRRKTGEEIKTFKSMQYPEKSKMPLIQVWRQITPRELSQVLNKDMHYMSELFADKMVHPDYPIDDMKLLQLVMKRGGYRMEIIGKPVNELKELEDLDVHPRPKPDKSLLQPRPPVVTIMGHVDHGKTTLLDALRHTSVVEKEFGGITQHIGAFSVQLDSGAKVTFLDTPGHAAFYAMRARGANITDIVVLVVAADDGVMEQTVESIRMAKQARVPILIAINKIDSHKADIERTKRTLLEAGLQIEECGGDIQSVPISALKRQNLDALVEALVLQAELLEIKADYTGPVEAAVVESRVDPHRGKLCTIVIKRGTLKKGSVLVAGTAYGKVRSIRDADNRLMAQATPGYAVEIDGWKEFPSAGELVLEVESEKRAREVIRVREKKMSLEKAEAEKEIIMQKAKEHREEYEEKLKLKRKLGRFKLKQEGPRRPELEDDHRILFNMIIKGDVDGSVEAIIDTLDTYNSNLCEMDLVHFAVGTVTESDIELAKAFNAVIYAFNLDVPTHIQELAEKSEVPIKNFNVIYKLVDDVKDELNARVPPVEVEEVAGEATVLQQFMINQGKKQIPVAGCKCTKGTLKKNGVFKVIRNDEIIYTGPLSSLRHHKNEVETIKVNSECGLQLSDKTVTFQQGDTIQCLEKVLKPRHIDWDPGF
ncbi:translation initiation factor IF-2, mitochondrial [Coccinella septempunctata]|uniref:translation initiation factor IF-2, mitochondrial n=1 Tax=Coccinella septempunctata TaxID=41139 RepID=UPI001D097023|nr:translation initiation factor IF-2, mitochondrial [Coccinella septempunctata]